MSTFFRRLFYAVSYLGSPPWDTGISPPELIAFIKTHFPGRALDLGCGSGTNMATLQEYGWQVTGIDFSGRAVQLARRRLTSPGFHVNVLHGDVSKELAVTGQFDLILDIGCYHDLSPTGRLGYRNNIKKYLAFGGTYLLYGHCLSPDRPHATGINQEDIEAFSEFLKVENIVHTTDRWERKTIWMIFVNPDQSGD